MKQKCSHLSISLQTNRMKFAGALRKQNGI